MPREPLLQRHILLSLTYKWEPSLAHPVLDPLQLTGKYISKKSKLALCKCVWG